MKKNILILSLLVCVSATQAEYMIQYKVESVNFKKSNLWKPAEPILEDWKNIGAVYGCSNWSPSESTITINQSFSQTATDCQQNQTRSRQDREQETTTNEYRNVGAVITETKIITASLTRTATGTKETWVAITPTYTDWANSGVLSECSNWTPDASTVDAGKTFTQTATDCKQPQTRTVQNREQALGSKEIRNVGAPNTENNTITTSSSREAKGVKAVPKVCAYGVSTWAYVPPNLTLNWKETTTPLAERFSIVIPLSSTSYVKDGYLYTAGRPMFSQGSNLYSEICRQPI